MNYTTEINGNMLEYIDEQHIYLIDGIIVPSVTQILQQALGNGYDSVPKDVLEQAARKGTQMHEDIERFCKTGEEVPTPELRNFKFLKKAYKFGVIDNEVPVILYHYEDPVAAGRMDMLIQMNGELGIADLKRQSTVDKTRLAYQLNLYRLAYQQSYKKEITFLRGIQLREDVRKFIEIPINEQLTEELICSIQ